MALTVLSTFTAAVTGACREIVFCDPETQPCGPPVVDSSTAGAGSPPTNTGGDGGEAPVGTECEPGFDDCDQSTLNGCEAQLAVDPWNCGRCRASCAGLCAGGRCRALEYASSDAITDTSWLMLGTQHVYFVLAPMLEPGHYALQRVSKETLAIETLLESNPGHRIEQLGLGLDRLYFIDSFELWSVGLAGSGLRDEQLAPDGFVESEGWLYWFERGSDELKRRPMSSPPGSAAESLPLSADAAQIVAHQHGPLLALQDESGSSPRYEIRLMNQWPMHELVAEGTGNVVRVRQTSAGIYWLVEAETNGQKVVKLLYVSSSAGTERLLDSGPDLVDFAVDAARSLLYVSYSSPSRAGLRVLSQDLGLRLDAGSKDAPMSLEYDTDQLWFSYPRLADPSQRFLARLPTEPLFE